MGSWSKLVVLGLRGAGNRDWYMVYSRFSPCQGGGLDCYGILLAQ